MNSAIIHTLGRKCIKINGFSDFIDQSLLRKGFDEQISCPVKVAVDCILMSSMLYVYKNIKVYCSIDYSKITPANEWCT